NQRSDVPVLIDNREIRCIAGGRSSRPRIAVGMVRVNEFGTLGRVTLAQESFDGYLCEPWISVVTIKIGVGKLHRLNSLVHFSRSSRAGLIRRKRTHDVEHFQRSHALAIRWKLIDSPA